MSVGQSSSGSVARSGLYFSRQACALMMAFAIGLVVLSLIPGAREQSFLFLNQAGAVHPWFWSGLSSFGDTLLALAFLLPFVLLRPQLAGLTLYAALIATAITHTLKPLLAVPRPAGVLDQGEFIVIGHTLYSQAFPSGHSVTSFVLVGLLVIGLQLKGWKATIALGLGILMILSRVTVGAHWPTDILAGALIGWLSVMAAQWLLLRWPFLEGGRGMQIVGLVIMTGCVLYVPFFDAGYPQGGWMHGLITAWAITATAWLLYQRKLSGKSLLKGT